MAAVGRFRILFMKLLSFDGSVRLAVVLFKCRNSVVSDAAKIWLRIAELKIRKQ